MVALHELTHLYKEHTVCMRFIFNIFCLILLSGISHLKSTVMEWTLNSNWNSWKAMCPSETGGGEKGLVIMSGWGTDNSRLEQVNDVGLTANLRSVLDWFAFQNL